MPKNKPHQTEEPENATPQVDPKDLQMAELTADLQRLQAEFINFKRRSEEERSRAMQSGKEQAVVMLLPILDNLGRAIKHEPEDIKEHSWVKGIGAVAKQLEGQLESIGLRNIGVVGEAFNPNLHEAVAMEDSDGDTEVIAEVLQTGYIFGDFVLRPAMVRVTRR